MVVFLSQELNGKGENGGVWVVIPWLGGLISFVLGGGGFEFVCAKPVCACETRLWLLVLPSSGVGEVSPQQFIVDIHTSMADTSSPCPYPDRQVVQCCVLEAARRQPRPQSPFPAARKCLSGGSERHLTRFTPCCWNGPFSDAASVVTGHNADLATSICSAALGIVMYTKHNAG